MRLRQHCTQYKTPSLQWEEDLEGPWSNPHSTECAVGCIRNQGLTVMKPAHYETPQPYLSCFWGWTKTIPLPPQYRLSHLYTPSTWRGRQPQSFLIKGWTLSIFHGLSHLAFTSSAGWSLYGGKKQMREGQCGWVRKWWCVTWEEAEEASTGQTSYGLVNHFKWLCV